MDREDSIWRKGISYFCGECGAQLGVEVTQPNHSCIQFLRAKNATLRAALSRWQEIHDALADVLEGRPWA